MGWRAAAFVGAALLAGGLAAGCTVMTVIEPPDAGPPPGDAGEGDGAVSDDGGFDPPPPTIDPCTPEGMGATVGQTCASNAACDDGCFCNGAERCEGGVCVAGIDPCTDTVECTADVCLEEANRCFHDPRHEMCGDGDACNGAEVCSVLDGCTSGTPLYCNDETSCTIDSCDTELGCVFEPRDLDGDGFTDGRCGGDDCDDDPRFGASIFPGAVEDCMNRRDDDCDGMRDYNDDGCLPTNDTCASAVVLEGAGTYSGSTEGLAGDYALECRDTGPDAVFRFTLTETRDVTVTVAGGGSGAAVALRPFDQCAIGPDDKCGSGSPPTFLRRSLPAGDYAIIVKSSSGVPFDLSLRFDDPTPIPMIDVCDDMTEDLCGGAPCTTVSGEMRSGMFVETEDDYTLTCASGTTARPDAAYTFTLDAAKDVTLRASTRDEFGSRTAYISVVTDCEDAGTELNCISGNPAEFRQREMPPGTYFVLIESSDSAPVSWDLEVTITDPVPRNSGDACSTAVDITEATPGGGGSGVVDITTIELDSGTGCGGTSSSFRDATFVFSLASTRDVTLTTRAGTTTSASTHYAQLQTACSDASTSLRCWSGGSTSSDLVQSWRSLPAGTYYLHTSTSRTTGDLTANLMTGDPTPIPPNDRCDGAIELTPGLRDDTTVDFEDDAMGGSCAGTGRPDAFYTFTLPVESFVQVNVTDRDSPATTFYLTLRNGDCLSGSEEACGTASLGETLPAGTYFLVLESSNPSDFRVVTSIFPLGDAGSGSADAGVDGGA